MSRLPSEFAIFRHGTAEVKRLDIQAGGSNVADRLLEYDMSLPLAPEGMKEADSLAERLEGSSTLGSAALMLSTDYRRGWETASRVAGHYERAGKPLRLIPDAGLREVSRGLWHPALVASGYSIRQKQELERWMEDPISVAPPNGENWRQASGRLWRVVCRAGVLSPDRPVMLSAHGEMTTASTCHPLLGNMSLAEMRGFRDGYDLTRGIQPCTSVEYSRRIDPDDPASPLTSWFGFMRIVSPPFPQENDFGFDTGWAAIPRPRQA